MLINEEGISMIRAGVTLLTTLLVLVGCASGPKLPIDEQTGRVISKSYNDKKKEAWQYLIALEDDQQINTIGVTASIAINECVNVQFFESGKPQAISDNTCSDDEFPIQQILITSDADQSDCYQKIKIGMGHKDTLKGAGSGAAQGALEGAIYPIQAGPLYPIVAPFFIIGGAIIGAGIGAVNNIPEEQIPDNLIPEIIILIRELGGHQQLQENLHQAILTHAVNINNLQFSTMRDSCDDGNRSTSEAVIENPDKTLILETALSNIGFMLAKKPRRKTGYSFASDTEEYEYEEDPEVKLFIYAQVYLLYRDIKKKPVPLTISHMSDAHKFSEWVSEDLELIRQELANANTEFAQKIMFYYFN
jgi:hypothetical protein